VLEIGHDQGESIPDLMRNAGFGKVEMARDLGGNARTVCGQQPGPE
jgi:methylase of polypeptide subunit release factors